METTQLPARDHLDDMLTVWAREIPDLDPLTEGVIERIQILARAFDKSMDETLKQYDLDRRSYHLLGRLRNYGPPYRRSAGQPADMRLSSGAMTNRLTAPRPPGWSAACRIRATGAARSWSPLTWDTRPGTRPSEPRPVARRSGLSPHRAGARELTTCSAS
jgi:hypothetical protein